MNDEIIMKEQDENLIENLLKFLKNNNKLIHLDLGNIGLTKNMLKQFGPALRRAKSLIALHLSGNPGIDSELKSILFNRIHCIPRFGINKINLMSNSNI